MKNNCLSDLDLTSNPSADRKSNGIPFPLPSLEPLVDLETLEFKCLSSQDKLLITLLKKNCV